MKKKLIEAIKAKFVGIDDNTAKRLAERTIAKSEAITNDDEVKVAVEAITLADVLKSVSDFSADESIKRYEEKYGLEKGEKKADPSNPQKDHNGEGEGKEGSEGDEKKNTPDELKALLKEMKDGFAAQMQSFKDELTAIKSGKISETRRAKLDGILKDLKDFQKKPYGRIDLSKMSEDEFETFIEEVKEEVGDMIAESRANDTHFTPPLGGGNRPLQVNGGKVKEASKDEIEALVGKFGLQEKNA